MTSRSFLVALLVVAALIVGALAVGTGLGPAPGGGDAGGTDVEDFPTARSTTTGGSSGTGGSTGTATPAPRPSFSFTIGTIEECGETCRDVTSTLENTGTAPATDVVVYTRIFVGQGTDGDVVWTGEEPVGELPAGESYTATRRVELSFAEGLAVRNADGWITIQTTVQSDQRTVTFTSQRDVA